MEFYQLTVRFFQNGGAFMYPIAAVLVVGLAIAIERWLVLTRARFTNRRAFDSAMALVKTKGFCRGDEHRHPIQRPHVPNCRSRHSTVYRQYPPR